MSADGLKIGNEWDTILAEEMEKPYYNELERFLDEEYVAHTIFPPRDEIFTAFRYTPYNEVKVLLLGQDPYHEKGQAHGMAFSVQKGVKQPPSLVNIFKEINSDLGIAPPPIDNGCLISWARSGVLLLNTVLTVREHEANSHRGKGWEQLTDAVIRKLNEREKPMVFILWGSNAKSKLPLITNKQHLVIAGAHPSPLSAYRGFFGGKYFSRANDFLERHGIPTVNWDIQQ
nr:uracil-DNA glycosylase [uncultured Mogibacterium sp.]